MKINLIDYIKKVGDATSLSALEQEKLESGLTEYMAMKPLRTVDSAQGKNYMEAKDSLFPGLFFMHSKRKYIPIAIILGLLLSGTASYAAEGAMPGDLLYPVKVGVNEKVVSTLAVSAESKATLEAKFAERRLVEATNLAVDNKLTAHIRAKLSDDFAKHADSAVARTKDLEKKNASIAIGLASNFESNLSAHEALLVQIDTQGDADDLVQLIRAKSHTIGELRMKAESGVYVRAHTSEDTSASSAIAAKNIEEVDTKERAALAMGGVAKTAVKDSAVLLARVSGNLEASANLNAQAQVKTASELLVKGDAFFEKKDFTSAFQSYQNALVAVKRLSVYLNVSKKVRINIFHPNEKALDDEKKNKSVENRQNTEGNSESRQVEDSSQIDIESKVHTGSVNVGGEGRVRVNVGI
ncbi:hypothetical protein EPO14_03355 [Patescibacteria group bacterium]|nr:MAG: hypothetical protein EPO14_03355 [Patescibacteria group bacterium]